MDKVRAQEILDSLGVIQVVHQQSPVWINSIEGEVVLIEYLDNSVKARVPVNELNESNE